RVLLSLFPDEMMANNVNPASMFISFISTKDFFSVINRKIIENYKLNLFDIAIDPFEFKIGFGENRGIKKKDVDLYYGYCSTANMNGYRFLNPANIGNGLALISSISLEKIFRKYPNEYFLNFLFAIYLLNFVFLARIKVFPFDDTQKDYNWFIEILFNFYELIFEQSKHKMDYAFLGKIKREVLGEINFLFLLFEHSKLFNGVFKNSDESDEYFYKWIFYDELKEAGLKNMIANFIDQREKFIYKSSFSIVERKILQYVLPADILLKYLFIDADISLVVSDIVSKVYDTDILNNKLEKFRKNKGDLLDVYMYITDYRNFKKSFFKGVQKYIMDVFQNEEKISGKSLGDEIDDMMSDIGDDPENLKNLKIPERIKKESKIMEKILNFYITLVGGLRIARGDNFYLRLFKKDIIKDSLSIENWSENKKNTIHYYGSLLYNYGKNVFYYKNIADNVRAGKQKFFLPYKNLSKNIYSNMHMVRMFDENFLATFLQWINTKDIKLYVNNKHILEQFKWMFSKNIGEIVKKNKNEMIDHLYKDKLKNIFEKLSLNKVLKKSLNDEDFFHIKDSMYSLDFWIYDRLLDEFADLELKKGYSDTNILGILSSLMDTLFGFMLYINYLKKNNHNKLDELYEIYCMDVLNISKHHSEQLIQKIKKMEKNFEKILSLWIELDDNDSFFKIASTNWSNFVQGKENVYKLVSGEDVLWFRGFLKNITYYNKRYIIPK
ncbi:MAG TPA: hypothetical protein PK674_03550, partial [Candidatus Absconditabacterales bacterium]|nr:hypothetical protein [Candidatus Absconditabacterales bacterium]HOQ79369.1 hypothetical protein [Candidatus Absconditabacterales bacterium]HPK28355.1 hypothetical protein [Candidatus Absconditabacterales bacterium]